MSLRACLQLGNVAFVTTIVDGEERDTIASVEELEKLCRDVIVHRARVLLRYGIVPCERTKAVVIQKTKITKLDCEKFGGETCKRQFVGVKFRSSSFVNMPFGSRMAELLKEDSS